MWSLSGHKIAMLPRGQGLTGCNGIHLRDNQSLDIVRRKKKLSSKQASPYLWCIEDKASNILKSIGHAQEQYRTSKSICYLPMPIRFSKKEHIKCS
jgi:hypothetical protein